jgi:Phosphoribosyl-ATP pyrophosphohydrolase
MHNAMNAVLEFYEAVDQHIGDPRKPDVTVDQELCISLIADEYYELGLALNGQDKQGGTLSPQEQIIATADALGDLCYVICGAAVTWGIDLGLVFDAIHVSNMSKTKAEKRSDGKVLKGPNYEPPRIAEALQVSALEATHGLGPDCFWPTPTVMRNLPPKKIDTAKVKSLEWHSSFHMGGYSEEPPPVKPELLQEAAKAIQTKLEGYFTSYGAYVFDCRCNRTQTVNTKAGTRGGFASKTECECMCGMHYELIFVENKGKDLTVQVKATDLSNGH